MHKYYTLIFVVLIMVLPVVSMGNGSLEYESLEGKGMGKIYRLNKIEGYLEELTKQVNLLRKEVTDLKEKVKELSNKKNEKVKE